MMDKGFPHMAEILKPAESEHFMVGIFEVTQKDVDIVRLRDLINRSSEYYGFEPGKYARLCHRNADGSRGPTIMSDTWMERVTNTEFVRTAKGDVLIGGLGIGMVLLAVQDKPEVDSIIVVEKEQEVIDLVKPQLPLNDKVTIVHADIFTWKPGYIKVTPNMTIPENGAPTKFDTIYFDIWDGISGDNWPEMKKLHKRMARWKKPGGWMSSWRKVQCQRMAKEDY